MISDACPAFHGWNLSSLSRAHNVLAVDSMLVSWSCSRYRPVYLPWNNLLYFCECVKFPKFCLFSMAWHDQEITILQHIHAVWNLCHSSIQFILCRNKNKIVPHFPLWSKYFSIISLLSKNYLPFFSLTYFSYAFSCIQLP
jgi:hypothetical protein